MMLPLLPNITTPPRPPQHYHSLHISTTTAAQSQHHHSTLKSPIKSPIATCRQFYPSGSRPSFSLIVPFSSPSNIYNLFRYGPRERPSITLVRATSTVWPIGLFHLCLSVPISDVGPSIHRTIPPQLRHRGPYLPIISLHHLPSIFLEVITIERERERERRYIVQV